MKKIDFKKLKQKFSIKKGDNVKVITGSDNGKTGEVLLVKDDRVVVSGINLFKKAVKNPQGGDNFVKKERSIHVSNVVKIEESSNFDKKKSSILKKKIK